MREKKKKEWERLVISSRKLEISGKHFMQRRHNTGQKSMGLTETDTIKKR